ncbi:MAG: AGE family epimerase/isomerase [Rhodobacteraceae bacterium]|nr:AGE family epimerase/isomerase [Paracoccaceae bacterium]
MSLTARDFITSDAHRTALKEDALRQFAFFDASRDPDGGYHALDVDGAPIQGAMKELHCTTRLVHSYALGKIAGRSNCDPIIDQGMAYLWAHHSDPDHGGYVWGLTDHTPVDTRKLAYGHVFVLLAGASAKAVGHPDADRLINDVDQVLDQHFWEDEPGLFCDEWTRDWAPFSTYRGMNSNMHGVEALLAAYEATGREKFLVRAGRILSFFMFDKAPAQGWRLPEHYTQTWQIDPGYAGDPMFRPAGTTPGHSFEMARLLLHYAELTGTLHDDTLNTARAVAHQALKDAWDPQHGGVCYTLTLDGLPDIKDRYWWPVTEAIGVFAALLKVSPDVNEAEHYRQLWDFAETAFIDKARGGWIPEIDAAGRPTTTQFAGKPDLYHALQAVLFPLTPRVSGAYTDLAGVLAA